MFESAVSTGCGATTEAVRDEYWMILHQRLVAGAKQRLALEAAEARDLVFAEEAELWRRFGYMSMLEYMQRELFYEGHTARERLRVANKLFELPLLAEAFREGELSFSALRELTRIVVPETEEAWIERALGKTAREVERMVSGLSEGASPGDRPDPRLERHRITLDVSGEGNAMWRSMRIALADERGQHLNDDEVVQTVARRALEPAGDGTSAPCLHAVTTCRVCKHSSLVAGGMETPLDDASRERLLCDSADAGDLESEGGQRLTAEIPARTRRRVLIRDRFACTVPGCTSCRNLDLHHVIFRANGGGHGMGNLTTLCSGHHRECHEGLLKIRGTAPDGLVFELYRHGEDTPHRVLTTVAQPCAVNDVTADDETSHVEPTRIQSHVGRTNLREESSSRRGPCPRLTTE